MAIRLAYALSGATAPILNKTSITITQNNKLTLSCYAHDKTLISPDVEQALKKLGKALQCKTDIVENHLENR